MASVFRDERPHLTLLHPRFMKKASNEPPEQYTKTLSMCFRMGRFPSLHAIAEKLPCQGKENDMDEVLDFCFWLSC